jgi:YgiT-type zinc finger domain-containing protein
MPCTSPGCTADLEAGTITHAVVYRRRTLTIDFVPAAVCPECGEASLTEETLEEITLLLQELPPEASGASGASESGGRLRYSHRS